MRAPNRSSVARLERCVINTSPASVMRRESRFNLLSAIRLDRCDKPTLLTPVEKRLRLVRPVSPATKPNPEEVMELSARSSSSRLLSSEITLRPALVMWQQSRLRTRRLQSPERYPMPTSDTCVQHPSASVSIRQHTSGSRGRIDTPCLRLTPEYITSTHNIKKYIYINMYASIQYIPHACV